MSVEELIQKVAELSPNERAVFEQLWHAMASSPSPPVPTAPVSPPDFAQRLRRIYGDKVVPDSQSIMR